MWTAAPVIGDESFAVLLGDDLIVGKPPATKQLIDVFYSTGKNVVGVMNVARDQTSKYGIIDPAEYKGAGSSSSLPVKTWLAKGMVEKPAPAVAPSTLAVPGRYVLTSEIFKILENVQPGAGGEIQLTDALAVFAKRGDLVAHEFEGQRFDTGDKLGYIDATLYFALQRPELNAGVMELLKKYVR